MYVELHVLQNFAPSCLNRDDTNSPKDCTFGDHRRARISSQCIKRSVRRFFKEEGLLSGENLAERSKRLIGEIAGLVRAKNVSPADKTEEAVKAALASIKLAPDSKKPEETQYLLFFGRQELNRLADVIALNFAALVGERREEPPEDDDEGKKKPRDDKGKEKTRKQKKSEAREAVPPDVAKAVKAVFDGGKAADVALFGRMLADQADLNIDAASQVAHALSTNRVEMEMDFFTAVDDLKSRAEAEDAGAGMLGTTEFNSACFYRYSNIHLKQLVDNLGGDTELARAAVKAYLIASVKAVPTGKQNSTAPQNPPSLVFAVVRNSGLWSLANAFEKPIHNGRDGGLVAKSIAALDDYWARLKKAYGTSEVVDAAVFQLDDVELKNLKDYSVDGLDGLVARVMGALPKEKP
jgi:CRISPR system Cascade subunit CasC